MDRGTWQESMGLQRVRHDRSDSARKNTFIHHIPWLSFARGAVVPCTHPTLGPCTPSLLLCAQGKFQIRHTKGMQDLQCTHPSTHSEDTWRLRLRLCSAYWVKHVSVLGSPCRLEAVLDQPLPEESGIDTICVSVDTTTWVSLLLGLPHAHPSAYQGSPRTSASSHCTFQVGTLSPFWKCFLALQ